MVLLEGTVLQPRESEGAVRLGDDVCMMIARELVQEVWHRAARSDPFPVASHHDVNGSSLEQYRRRCGLRLESCRSVACSSERYAPTSAIRPAQMPGFCYGNGRVFRLPETRQRCVQRNLRDHCRVTPI